MQLNISTSQSYFFQKKSCVCVCVCCLLPYKWNPSWEKTRWFVTYHTNEDGCNPNDVHTDFSTHFLLYFSIFSFKSQSSALSSPKFWSFSKTHQNMSDLTHKIPQKPADTHQTHNNLDPSAAAAVVPEETGRERLTRHRLAVAGQVWIPEKWGKEEFLKDWIDGSAFEASLLPSGVVSARLALVTQGKRSSSSPPAAAAAGAMRILNSCWTLLLKLSMWVMSIIC